MLFIFKEYAKMYISFYAKMYISFYAKMYISFFTLQNLLSEYEVIEY